MLILWVPYRNTETELSAILKGKASIKTEVKNSGALADVSLNKSKKLAKK
jgi:hypothetical protein